MKIHTIAAAVGLAVVLGSGSASAWDLHDTLTPGPTPETADSPPAYDPGSGADLQVPGLGLLIPDVSVSNGAPAIESRCREAIAEHGEHSAEAWTQC